MSSFLIYLIIPASLSPGDYSAPNINEYQKQEINVSGGNARLVRKVDNCSKITQENHKTFYPLHTDLTGYSQKNTRYEALAVLAINIVLFWDVTPYSSVV
jgi:hypothetical protein